MGGTPIVGSGKTQATMTLANPIKSGSHVKSVEAFDELRWKVEVRTGMMLNHLLYLEDAIRRIAKYRAVN